MRPSFPGPTVDETWDFIFNDLDSSNEENVTWNIHEFKKCDLRSLQTKFTQKVTQKGRKLRKMGPIKYWWLFLQSLLPPLRAKTLLSWQMNTVVANFTSLFFIIILFLSFLNCDWLLIREVQWFYWTQELLVPVEKFSVRTPMMGLELATPRLQTEQVV